MQIKAFTTNRVSPLEAVRRWQAGFDLVIKRRGLEPFFGSWRIYTSRRHRFAEIAASSHISASRPRESKPYLLALLKEGTARVLQDGREIILNPGESVLLDLSRFVYVEAAALRASMIEISPS